MTNVFIGSTSRDLADYRKAAIDTCLRLGLHPIAMEYFEAMPVGATEGSKRQLDKADLYVGIFAHRYGYIENGVSVTEAEFDYAGELKLDRLCFLVDPSYPWPPDAIDYANQEHLRAFKSRINTSLIRAQFTTVDNFTASLTHALAKWAAVQAPPPPPPPGSIAPPRPALVVGREDDLGKLKSRLTAPDQSARQTIIRGWPGVGKTTLVTALAYDEDIIKVFPDSVLWAHVGENASPFSELAAWGRVLGVPEIGKTLEEAIGRMRAILQHKRVLLIVDDIWKAEDAAAFQVAGPQCATLITTRFGDIARALAATPDAIYVLGVLSDDQALELLGRLAPTVVKDHPDQSRQLVGDLEGLPLALRVAGRVLEGEASLGVGNVTALMDELRASGKLLENVAPDDRFNPKTGTTPTISLLLQRSTDRLDPETREHFAVLGAFAPKPATFDLAAMKAVWLVGDPLPSVRKLVDCGLLEPIPARGRFWMHHVLVMHAESLLED